MCTTYTWQFTNMYICSSDVTAYTDMNVISVLNTAQMTKSSSNSLVEIISEHREARFLAKIS